MSMHHAFNSSKNKNRSQQIENSTSVLFMATLKCDGWPREPSGVWILRLRNDWDIWDQNPKVLINKGRLTPNSIPLLKGWRRIRRYPAIVL